MFLTILFAQNFWAESLGAQPNFFLECLYFWQKSGVPYMYLYFGYQWHLLFKISYVKVDVKFIQDIANFGVIHAVFPISHFQMILFF